MNDLRNVYIEKDKTNAPFLLAASFQGILQFEGSYIENGVIHWKFSSKDKALAILDQFRTKTEPRIPARDLFQAIETFWRQVSQARNGEMKYDSRT